MGDVINIWSWRKPDRPPSKCFVKALEGPKQAPATPQAAVIESYTRAMLTRFKEGLAGPSNPFYVTIDTNHPNVSIPDWLRERYNRDITIVFQNEWANLQVMANGFGVRMHFSQIPCDLIVPFSAITRVIDQRAGLTLDRVTLKPMEPWNG